MSEQRQRVRAAVSDLLARKGDARPFADGERLLTEARLDSLDVLELVTFLESSFGIDFAVRPFDQAIFDSIDSLVEFLITSR